LYTIHLRNIILYGRHGVYTEENKIDAPFEINISCTLGELHQVNTLEDTINYADIFETVKEIFATPFLLLEVLANEIAEKIKYQNKHIVKIKISIYKLNAPIAGMQGQVGITLEC
jgi:dihydroneopterin aldolase